MKNFIIAFRVELLKNKKSRVFWATVFVFTFLPLMIGLMIYVASNPEISQKLGIVGVKAKMLGQQDWKGYLTLINQSLAGLGLIGFGFVTSWVFGNEHINRTFKDILAVPIGRLSMVGAKLLLVFVWCIFLAIVLFLVSCTMGFILNLPHWSNLAFADFVFRFFGATGLTLLLLSPIAWLTGYTRGIIAPLGFVIFTMIIANFTGLVGLGPYFPWAIPGLLSSGGQGPEFHLVLSSYILIFATFLVGFYATLKWWRNADHY
ncbi:MAG: ABC transporter permease [Bacteroidales bacterium]|nr:ABC transporter permease [Bacteroidales bacterium]